jgi:hypothetical protein
MHTKYNTIGYAANGDDDRECELEEEFDGAMLIPCLIRCNA